MFAEPVKSSYNEVLQWLFRAQQRNKSPPGALLFRTESNKSMYISPFFSGNNIFLVFFFSFWMLN